MIQTQVSQLKRVPLHVGVVLPQQELAISQLSKLICWCLCADIHHITLFDSEGILKRSKRTLLEDSVNREKRRIFKDKISQYDITFSTPESIERFHLDSTRETQGIRNYERGFEVQLTSLEDSRWDMIHVAKEFCKAVEQKRCAPSDLSADLLHNNLSMSKRPDPDLLINVGASNILQGFFPWHIRLSEICHVPTIQSIHPAVFVSMLEKYSVTAQRFGS